MNFTTTTLKTPPCFLSPLSSFNLSQKPNTQIPKLSKPTCSFTSSFNLSQKPNSPTSKLSKPRCSFSSSFTLSSKSNALVSQKVQLLSAEFRSLPEPIDRVKLLLHYAAELQQMDAEARVEENKVAGCATQVWVEVEMDEFGRIGFRADSDSEITKGFCYCLVWLFDGAEAEEVLRVRAEELGDLSVGVFGVGKVSSRVNGWFNVFETLQRRARDLVCERRKRTRMVVGVESFGFGPVGVNVDEIDGGCCVDEGRGNEVLVSV